jgi:hypothetical protein
VIIGEQALFDRKTNKKGRPTGKAVLTGFTLDFSAPLNSATAANTANFQVDTITKKKLKKRSEIILHPITNFMLSYVAASDAVEIIFWSQGDVPDRGSAHGPRRRDDRVGWNANR